MNNKNREVMQRAIGIIEGVASSCNKEQQDTLYVAVEMLDDILRMEDEK